MEIKGTFQTRWRSFFPQIVTESTRYSSSLSRTVGVCKSDCTVVNTQILENSQTTIASLSCGEYTDESVMQVVKLVGIS
jgi:hypothetical protein